MCDGEFIMEDFDLKVFRKRMDGALSSLKSEFGGLRTGRASVGILDGVKVNAYGSEMMLNQVGSVTVPEPRMLLVNVWDKTLVQAADKAIRQSNLGLNPIVDGQNLRIPMPPLTEERRKELVKVAGSYSENSKVAVRNVRRDAMETVKKLERSKAISEDELKAHESDIQLATNSVIAEIDSALNVKSNEIMQV
jgi:ribosome recycling factor